MTGAAPARPGMLVLEARALAAAPPGAPRAVFEKLSLELRAGEWLAIGGANGSGKSTLAMALAGLWPAVSGEVRLCGAPLRPGDTAPRRDVAVVFQDPASQLLQSTVRDELEFAARNLDHPGDRIERELVRVAGELGLRSELEHDPRTLSAGRQQLVLLGAALVAAPVLLVADEPGAHLDREARARMLAAVRARVAAGLAVLWVTQDGTERAAADRCLTLGPAPEPPSPGLPAGGPAAHAEHVAEVHIGAPSETGPAVRIPGLSRLRIPERGIVAVTGPNGSGKTVLISAMAGLIATDQVRVDWRRPPALPPIIATQYPEMQIFEEIVEAEIAHAAVSRGRPRPEVQCALLQRLEGAVDDTAAFVRRRCWTLSAGEKRLIGLLGALLAPAPLVLLDEPTAGLDKRLRTVAGEWVAARAMEGPVVVATQDIEWATGLGAVAQGAFRSAAITPSHR